MTGIQPVGVQPQEKKTGGAGKAWCSVPIVGLGQLIDGRTGAGLGYMGASAAAGITSFLCSRSLLKDVFEMQDKEIMSGVTKVLTKAEKTKLISKAAGSVIGGLASVGIWIANIIDAYKGDRSKKEQ